MSPDPVALQAVVRRVLTIFRSRGWTDRDGAAIAVATAAYNGADITSADVITRLAVRQFLTQNDASAHTVASVLRELSADRSNDDSKTLDATALILTALPSEYDAVVANLNDRVKERTPSGTRYEVGTLEGGTLSWRVAVADIGPGNTDAAIETATSIDHFGANVVLFVGVAGALKDDLEPGTVVVATRVYHYEGGKDVGDDVLTRPASHDTAHTLNQVAAAVDRQWREAGRPPVVRKPISAGELVVASSGSGTAAMLAQRFNDAVAVDMESYGVYEAAFRNGSTLAIAIRGISDRLDDKTVESDTTEQPIAATNAAAFAFDLLRAAEPDDVFPQARRDR